MNGGGGSGGGGGGGGQSQQYISEDDFDDYKPSTAASYYPAPNPLSTQSQSHQGLISTGGGGGGGSQQQQGLNFSTTAGVGGGSQGSSSSSRNQICCLVDDTKRCNRFAGNASYSKRIQKTVYYKRLKLEIDLNANHIYICDYHKMVIQNARSRQKKESDDEVMNDGDDIPEVDLFQLQVNTLRRYKKHFKIPSRPGLNKAQLADILMRHFKTIPVTEKETVTYFIYMIKSEKNKLDNLSRAGGNNDNSGNGGGGNSEFVDRY